MNTEVQERLNKLSQMRSLYPFAYALGLPTVTVQKFLSHDSRLAEAIDRAYERFHELRAEYPDLFRLNENELIIKLQEGLCNFYGPDAVKPYVPMGAQGPWIVSISGAVIFNVGSYGMLGFGHAPKPVMEALSAEQVMANVMTANFSQWKFTEKIRKEIGHNRADGCPYHKFICLNSGSEAVTLASTLADVHTKNQTDLGAMHEGKKIMFMSLKGAFHGRTGRAARLSDSTAHYYRVLASSREDKRLITVPANDCEALEKAFERIDQEGIFLDSFFMEPVMGEGNPGKAITPEFYALARRLTKERQILLVVDSIQAGFRAHGCLSVVDYPGFENLDAPDMETYSKALNAGQFPVSVVALSRYMSDLYQVGIYGNTMTTNPRALDVMSAVMDMMTPEIRRNVRERGTQMLRAFEKLKAMYPEKITQVQGCGLLLSMSLNPDYHQAGGRDSLEFYMRQQGVNVIHGGKNALRFTPSLDIRPEEVDLVIDSLHDALSKGPVISKAA